MSQTICRCAELCHPGRCPACTATVMAKVSETSLFVHPHFHVIFFSAPVVGSRNDRSVESLCFVAPHATSPFPVVATHASLSATRGPASHVMSPSPRPATVQPPPGTSPALRMQSWSSLALNPVLKPWIVGYTPAPLDAILDPAHHAHLL